MRNYNIEEINDYLDTYDFDKLNEIMNSIITSNEHDFNDLEIIKAISSSSAVSIESKNQLKLLYLKYKKEIEEKIFAGESKLPTRISDSEYELKLTPSKEPKNSEAYINFNTTLLIIGLTILVIIAIAGLTLKG